MARRARNIFRRKDGRYEGRFIKERDGNGKAIYGSVYARKYVEVKAKLEQAILNCKAMEALSESRTVQSQSVAYLSAIECAVKPSSYDIYERYIKNHISPYFKDLQCRQLTVEVLQEFIDKLSGNGLSSATVQAIFSFLKSCLGGAVSRDVFKVTLTRSKSAKARALSGDEQKRLETAAKHSDDINFIAVTLDLYTGLRIGEICGLMWDDVDFERKLLHVRRTVQRIKNTNEDSCKKTKTITTCLDLKSDTSHRIIPLPELLLSILAKYRKKSSSNSYVLSNYGRLIEPRCIQYRFKKLLIKASINDANFHILRHTFATRALEKGFDLKTLSEILGHSSAAITLKTYAHAMYEQKRCCMESLMEIYKLVS